MRRFKIKIIVSVVFNIWFAYFGWNVIYTPNYLSERTRNWMLLSLLVIAVIGLIKFDLEDMQRILKEEIEKEQSKLNGFREL
jgi:hypothetical protein